jgi:hypothetical protein
VADEVTDRVTLTTREYPNPERLDARYALYRYRRPGSTSTRCGASTSTARWWYPGRSRYEFHTHVGFLLCR